MILENKFYVYFLYRDILRNDPFYVGKGHGDRIDFHARLLEKGKRVNHLVSRAITMAGKPGPNLGRKFSAETRARMRESQLKRWASAEIAI